MLASLHECGHILLGHLPQAGELRAYSASQEAEADRFAVNTFLDREDLSYNTIAGVAVGSTVLFGFNHLVTYYSGERDHRHPPAMYRWANIRPLFVEALGDTITVDRIDRIIGTLFLMQTLTFVPGENS